MNGLPVSRRARDVSPWLFPAFSQGTRFFFFLQRRLLKPLRDGGWEKGGEEPFWWRRKVSSFPVDKSGFPFLSLPGLFFRLSVLVWVRSRVMVSGCGRVSLPLFGSDSAGSSFSLWLGGGSEEKWGSRNRGGGGGGGRRRGTNVFGENTVALTPKWKMGVSPAATRGAVIARGSRAGFSNGTDLCHLWKPRWSGRRDAGVNIVLFLGGNGRLRYVCFPTSVQLWLLWYGGTSAGRGRGRGGGRSVVGYVVREKGGERHV